MTWITRCYPLGGREEFLLNAMGVWAVINSKNNNECVVIDASDFLPPNHTCGAWEEVPPEIKTRMENIANLIAGTLNMLGV